MDGVAALALYGLARLARLDDDSDSCKDMTDRAKRKASATGVPALFSAYATLQ